MIELQNVSFSYPEQENGSLHNINLTISDGECILLCGRSGCGKTTVTRLINGLIPDFYSGELTGRILIEKQNIADLPMYQIAERLALFSRIRARQFFNV